MKSDRDKIKYYKLMGFTFFLMIAIFSVLQFALPDKEYSAAEKRNLQGKPTLSWSSMKSHDFSSDTEKYMTDQVPGRDTWVYLNTMMNRILGKNISNGVYNGKDGYLIGQFKLTDGNSQNIETTKALKDFLASRGTSNSYVLLAPTAFEITKDKLPSNVLGDSEKDWYAEQTKVFDQTNTKLVNLFPAFEGANDKTQLYYKTDHHWTSEGAYTAFEELAKVMELDTSGITFTKKTVNDDFQGTLMSKSGFYGGTKDKIDIYQPKDKELNYIVNYEEEQYKTTSIFNEEGLKSDDPYQVFFGGNYPIVKIQTDVQSDRKLLILKDSYANAMVQFLLPFFSEIDMIDARYYAGNIQNETDASGYTDILALYNIETYSEDQTIKTLLQS